MVRVCSPAAAESRVGYRLCVSVCAFAREHVRPHQYSVALLVFMAWRVSVCVCVCVCVCVRARARALRRDRHRPAAIAGTKRCDIS